MHASRSGVPGMQSGEVKLAAVTLPVVPVIFSAARFSSRRTSAASMKPEPLRSVHGRVCANTAVPPEGADADEVDGQVRPAGVAALGAAERIEARRHAVGAARSSPASQPALVPDTSTSR